MKNFTATLDCMKSYFTDNQLFFFHFLPSCDSYEFSELVKHQLERHFYAIREMISPSTDACNEFTEVVLRLKVVAKFLEYLRFSPQWQVSSSIHGLSAQNAAFKAVERKGISTLELLTLGKGTAPALGEDAARASFQMFITSKTRHEPNATVVVALAEALRLGEEPVTHGRSTENSGAEELTEFGKRVAFRNKRLLKDLESASKGTAAASPSSTTTSAINTAPQQAFSNMGIWVMFPY
ncbi:hypothetical protein PHYPSEUDO_013680 [Phytophthora pseudosyringae]|uniref:Uncharacterized protein n=1 Tax=Phytophthora pseudosyringae TaxID=221518 RepID=A0A8T1W383_9STRA|nr:hypothetical protein PHYPSEUDO_013680 [Phytophthora pseudosyringae]